MKKETKALIKDLELQIDYLIGYCPQGLHWKKEYHFRQDLIDLVLCDKNTPQEIVDKIQRIQDSLYRLQNDIKHDQEYMYYSEMDYKITHKIKVNDYLKGQYYI